MTLEGTRLLGSGQGPYLDGPLRPARSKPGSVQFSPSLNDAGTVAFQATLAAGGEAILTGSGGNLTTVADTSGPSRSVSIQTAINNTGTVVFKAELPVTPR